MDTIAVIKQVFGERRMSHKYVFEWNARFRAGRTAVEDSGRPISSIIHNIVIKFQYLFQEDKHLTIQDC